MRRTDDIKRFKDLLEAIRQDPAVNAFFNRLWQQRDFASLFFAHKESIFSSIELEGLKIPLRFLFFDNFEELSDDIELNLLPNRAELKKQQYDRSVEAFQSPFEGLSKDLKYILTYFLLRFIAKNPVIKSLIQEENVTYKRVREVIGDTAYNFEIFEGINFNEIWSEPEKIPGDDPLLQNICKNMGSFKNTFTKVVDKFLPLMLNQTYTIIPFSIYGHHVLRELLKKQNLEFQEYKNILFHLYILKLLTNVFTVFYCPRCYDEPITFITTDQISPLNLSTKCPKCDRTMAAITAYKLHPLIEQSILYRDGFLAVAFGWLLEEERVEYKSFVSLPDGTTEIDFILYPEQPIVVECRMHKLGKDEETIKAHLKNDLADLIKHLDALEAQGTKTHAAYVFCNYSQKEYGRLMEEILRTFKPRVKEYNLENFEKPYHLQT